ncbi:MAG: Rrf2 family transcriptional regulator [Planctomycetota bacterium]|nr:MAG: Rrf2 family transcriptional regulator [Planctomycetota bacterium]
MLSASSEYALRALGYLASESDKPWVLSHEIAKKLSLPPHFLAKILRTLATEKILKSQRGRSGGFRLARSPKEIYLFEIVEPIDRLTQREACLLGHTYCTLEVPCPLHNTWQKIMEDFLNLLKNTTLSELSVSLFSGECFTVPPDGVALSPPNFRPGKGKK